MSKLMTAVAERLKYESGKSGQHALTYLETGDQASLEQIKPSRSNPEWLRALRMTIAAPDAMEEEDRRALHIMAASEAYSMIGQWLTVALECANEDETLHDLVAAELASVNVPKAFVDTMTVVAIDTFTVGGRPNSAGRYLLGLADEVIRTSALSILNTTGKGSPTLATYTELTEFLLDAAPDRVEPLLSLLLDPRFLSTDVCKLILSKGAGRFEAAVVAAWPMLDDRLGGRMELAKILFTHEPERYGRQALEVARAVLANKSLPWFHGDIAVWILQNFGADKIDEIVTYLETAPQPEQGWDAYGRMQIVTEAVKLFGIKAVPVIRPAMTINDADLLHVSLTQLIRFDDATLDDQIQTGLARGLAKAEEMKSSRYIRQVSDLLIPFIKLAARWKPATVADRLWELLGHKEKGVRDAAARALGRIGAAVVPLAAVLLTDKNAENRAIAVIVLKTVGTPEALVALERRLDNESDDDVRDAILEVVDAARVATGREVTPEEVALRIQRAASKLKAPPAKWLDESRLAALKDREGNPLGAEATRYLFHRQSRAKEIRADVEARPLYDRIDRSTSGDFALEVLRQFAGTKADAKERWVLAIAGILGDDRAVPVLIEMIQAWGDSSRFKMAEYAVQALALLGSEAAMLGVDATAIRYRTKNKSVGVAAQEAFAAAAERLGLTVDELGDLVVPWLGFEPAQPRVVGPEGKRVELRIGPDFKLKYRDLEKNKAISSPPKSLPKETLAELKDMGVTLRESARVQKARLENLMVRQFRWPSPRWRELFLNHPVLFLPFATRLVWGHHDESGARLGTFRALEDRTLTTSADEAFAPPESGSIGIVYPLELSEVERAAWRIHLADYEIEPPFLQLERPIERVDDKRRDETVAHEVSGTGVNAMTFRSRAEKLGWIRGPVVDAGTVDVFRKAFPNAVIDAFLEISGYYMGIGVDDTIGLGDYYFLKEGTIRAGDYVNRIPDGEDRWRKIPFGELPALVYSEVTGDVKRIAGQATTSEGAEPPED